MASLSFQDFTTIGFLVFLEGILSIDNAVVLALLAKGLPPHQQRKALTYGLLGAFVFRFIALFFVSSLISLNWVKFAGGGYLMLVALKHFLTSGDEKQEVRKSGGSFWRVVLAIELTDVAFALDSILAAVAVTQKFWIVFTGGVLGIVMMRFAASLFLRLLKRFPRFETTAYLLVLMIGTKLVIQGFRFEHVEFESSRSPAFWIFWLGMLGCILFGFLPKRRDRKTERVMEQEVRATEDLAN